MFLSLQSCGNGLDQSKTKVLYILSNILKSHSQGFKWFESEICSSS